jgi:hypothetical protein
MHRFFEVCIVKILSHRIFIGFLSTQFLMSMFDWVRRRRIMMTMKYIRKSFLERQPKIALSVLIFFVLFNHNSFTNLSSYSNYVNLLLKTSRDVITKTLINCCDGISSSLYFFFFSFFVFFECARPSENSSVQLLKIFVIAMMGLWD